MTLALKTRADVVVDDFIAHGRHLFESPVSPLEAGGFWSRFAPTAISTTACS